MGYSLLLPLMQLTLSASSFSASHPPAAHFRWLTPLRNDHRAPTQLRFSVCTTESLSAAAAVVCPALVGMKADNLRNGIGPLVTIVAASHFSSLNISPTAHHLYEICWTKFLPASLSLLLLSPSTGKGTRSDIDATGFTCKRTRVRDNATDEIIAMSIPFLLGCLGSVLGCFVSYLYCWLGKDNAHRVHRRILPGRKHFFFQPGRLLLEPTEAAVAAGCLLSSYIGGSMNYFATARLISMDQDLAVDANTGAAEVLHGTFGSAASDMLVMPIYYSALTAMSSSQMLRRWFPGRMSISLEEKAPADDRCSLEGNEQTSSSLSIEHEHDSASMEKRWRILALIAPAVWTIVAISEKFEQVSSIPGSGIASISILSCIASTSITNNPDIGNVTQQLSNICYYMLLSVIGVSMNLRRLTLEGWWSSCSSILFATVPLIVHFAVILVGSLGLTRFIPNYELGIEQIVAASNAAICGPFSAAALIGKLSGDEDDSSHNMGTRWKGLALAATFWGIVGYAMATNIGVSISIALLSRIK